MNQRLIRRRTHDNQSLLIVEGIESYTLVYLHLARCYTRIECPDKLRINIISIIIISIGDRF